MARVIRLAQPLDAGAVHAHAAAAAIRGEAERAAEVILEEAHEEGLNRGIAEAAAIVTAAHRHRENALREAEAEIAAAVVEIARRVIGDAFVSSPELILGVVSRHLDLVRRAKRIELAVHPDDAPLLRATPLEGPTHVVVEDASIERGGCIVRSELGTIDARIEVTLDAIRDVLAGPHDEE